MGRTGRVMKGVNIRLFSRKFYEQSMIEFDLPEIATSPLGTLYIDALFFSAAWKLPIFKVQ